MCFQPVGQVSGSKSAPSRSFFKSNELFDVFRGTGGPYYQPCQGRGARKHFTTSPRLPPLIREYDRQCAEAEWDAHVKAVLVEEGCSNSQE
jgi:hypothetical protein